MKDTRKKADFRAAFQCTRRRHFVSPSPSENYPANVRKILLMSRHKEPQSRSIRIRCEMIERVYGSGNFDDAGDALVESLRLISEYADQYRYRFDTDSAHPNPWYHVMVFEIEDIPDSAYQRLIEKVASLGLIEIPSIPSNPP